MTRSSKLASIPTTENQNQICTSKILTSNNPELRYKGETVPRATEKGKNFKQRTGELDFCELSDQEFKIAVLAGQVVTHACNPHALGCRGGQIT